MKKIGCLIYFWGDKYERMGHCALNSFKKYHPDITLHHINEENRNDFKCIEAWNLGHRDFRYMVAVEIMKTYQYDKMIVLGGDTITCGRLDEFLDNNEHDILATLDYPYPLIEGGRLLCPNQETHLNADVVCFNKIAPIVDIIKMTSRFPEYAEQAALNYVVWSPAYNYSCNIVDGPYIDSSVVYNVRSKGNMCLPYEYQDHSATTGVPPKFPSYEKPWGKYTSKFYVKNDKLYTNDDKQIKVWHYCEGFGAHPSENLKKIMNNYIFKWFNEETKIFFKEQCDCGDFFEKEFTF